MLKTQRFLLNLVSLGLLILAVVLLIQNLAVTTDAAFLGVSFPGTPLSLLLAVSGLLVGGSVFLKMLTFLAQAGQQWQKASREIERREVSREEAEARVKVLESKVQTLEKALQEALKSGQAR
jgi:hypothetical protein